ncbi:hypothetical protein BJ742DRAFT_471638 [Cladochytrium replicatum]|nr:hypothetical protein BJ742DRAFT_471638 [Cladochytrium replicatum]
MRPSSGSGDCETIDEEHANDREMHEVAPMAGMSCEFAEETCSTECMDKDDDYDFYVEVHEEYHAPPCVSIPVVDVDSSPVAREETREDVVGRREITTTTTINLRTTCAKELDAIKGCECGCGAEERCCDIHVEVYEEYHLPPQEAQLESALAECDRESASVVSTTLTESGNRIVKTTTMTTTTTTTRRSSNGGVDCESAEFVRSVTDCGDQTGAEVHEMQKILELNPWVEEAKAGVDQGCETGKGKDGEILEMEPVCGVSGNTDVSEDVLEEMTESGLVRTTIRTTTTITRQVVGGGELVTETTEVSENSDSSCDCGAVDMSMKDNQTTCELGCDDKHMTSCAPPSVEMNVATSSSPSVERSILRETKTATASNFNTMIEGLVVKGSLGRAKLFLFDVLCVFDWRKSVSGELAKVGIACGITGVQWDSITDEWCSTFARACMNHSNTKSEALSRSTLQDVLVSKGISIPEPELDELARVWSRLSLYEDSTQAIKSMKEKYFVCSMSSCLSMSDLFHLSRQEGCTCWNTQLSREVVGSMPTSIYSRAVDIVGCDECEIVFVTSEVADAKAAHDAGMTAVLVKRGNVTSRGDEDVIVDSLEELQRVVFAYAERKAEKEEDARKAAPRGWFQRLADAAADIGKAVSRVKEE